MDFIAAYPIFPIVIGLLAIGLLLLNGYRLTVRLRQPSGAVLSALEPEDVLVGFPQRDEAKRMTGISQLALPSTLVPEVTTRPAEFGSLLYAIDSISDLVMVVDAIGEIHTLNHAFERATGWTREEWVGKALGGLILPQDAPKLDDTIELAVKQETPKTASIHIRTKDDRFVIVELTARPVKQQDPIADVLLIGKLETRYGWPSWSRLAE